MNVPLLGSVVIQPVSEEDQMVIVMGQQPVIRMMPPKIFLQVTSVLVPEAKLLFPLLITATMMRTVLMEVVRPPNGGLPVMA